MTLQQFNSNYVYQTDTSKFNRKEVWDIIKPDSDGKYRGDCESYMLTILDLGLISKDTKLYYCKIGGGHCIGILDNKVIDCNCKEFIRLESYKRIYSMTNLRKYWKIEMWWYKTTTKLFGYVPFIN